MLFISTYSIISCNQTKSINGLSEYQNIKSVSDFAPELWIIGNTFKGSLSDDYKTFYFFRKVAPEIEKYVPYESSFVNGKWEEPEVMDYFDNDYSYTYQLKVPNSNKLIFISNKKTKKDTTHDPNYNFWEIEIVNNKYGEPQEFGYKNLIYNYNSQPCITKDNTLFFTSDLPDWSKAFSYQMEFRNGKYTEPELFEPVNEWRNNKDWTLFEFCVSPNKNYLIVCIKDKKDNDESVDLYISYLKNEKWTYPQKLGSEINTSETENFPTITNDGKYLIFTRAFSEFKIVATDKFN